MNDNFSGRIQLTRQPLLHSWQNQTQMTKAEQSSISLQLWKIIHKKHAFLGSLYNWASLLIQNRNFKMQMMECWYLESRETIY